MSIKVEEPKKWRTELATAYVRGLKRHVNGQWSASVVVRLRVHLKDGRAIYGLHVVPIHCNQLGRKPHITRAKGTMKPQYVKAMRAATR